MAHRFVRDQPRAGSGPSARLVVGAELGLARHASPARGRWLAEASTTLVEDLPWLLGALGRDEVTEDRALLVVRETRDLTPASRREVDRCLAEELGERLASLGDAQLRTVVQRWALRVDDEQAARRARRARAQIRADVLVARVTGADPVEGPDLRVNLVVGAETLLGDATEPGTVHGPGPVSAPVPAGLCRDLVVRASARARAELRRLFVTPGDRELVAMESSRRVFPPALAELIDLRDGGACRTPWCDAPIRHHDHVVRHADGGATSLVNAQGLCEACNHTKEAPGWLAWVGDLDRLHEVTLTGNLQLATSRPPPTTGVGTDARGRPRPPSALEDRLAGLVLAA